MSEGTPIPYRAAYEAARCLVDELAAQCRRIEIAGSIRRRRPYVGDIEIVCIPKRVGLFDDDEAGESLLDARLKHLPIELTTNGRRQKRFTWPVFLNSDEERGHPCHDVIDGRLEVPVDLFITSPERWPVIFAIRTGPADFAKNLVTDRSRGGPLPCGYRVKGGLLYDDSGHIVPLETERDFLDFALKRWVEPHERG